MAHIALGVTGGIGAYKAVEVARELQQRGHDVTAILTRTARKFVGEVTFEAITRRRVITDQFARGTNADIEHISLATGIGLLLIAPATANVIGKFANGIADDFLSSLYLATRAPVLLAPAMNTNMLLSRFAAGDIDILVGTQMLAKGHDFPRVTLVGVISADVGLGLADFRAGERTFQLLTQVAGRAGRGTIRGEAIVQTLFPNHYSIRHACRQDYIAFYDEEIAFRRAMRYPPTVAMINAVVKGRTFAAAMTRPATAESIRLNADAWIGADRDERVHGPINTKNTGRPCDAPASTRKVNSDWSCRCPSHATRSSA